MCGIVGLVPKQSSDPAEMEKLLRTMRDFRSDGLLAASCEMSTQQSLEK